MVPDADVPHDELVEDANDPLPKDWVTDHRGLPMQTQDGKAPFEDFGFLAKTEEKRQEGNAHFRAGSYEDAIQSYGEAMMTATSMTTDPSVKLGKSKWAEVLILRSTVALNKSTAHLKVGDYKIAAEMAVECVFGPPRERQVQAEHTEQKERQYAMEKDVEMELGFYPPKGPPKKPKPLWKKLPKALRAKAWFRIAQCNAALDFPDRVRQALAMALEDATDDIIPEIQQFTLRFDSEQRNRKDKEKRMYAGFFNKLSESGGYSSDFHDQQKEKRKRFDALSIEEKFKKVNEMSDSEDEEGAHCDDDDMSYIERQQLAIRERYADQQESLLGPKYRERKRQEEASKPVPMKKEEPWRPLESYLEVKRALEVVPRRAGSRPLPQPPKRQGAPTSKNFKPMPTTDAELKAYEVQKAQEEEASKPQTAVRKGFFGWKKKGEELPEKKDVAETKKSAEIKYVPPTRGQSGPQQRSEPPPPPTMKQNSDGTWSVARPRDPPPPPPMKKNSDGTWSPARTLTPEEQDTIMGTYVPKYDENGKEIWQQLPESPEDLICVGPDKYIKRKEMPPELPQDPNKPPDDVGEWMGHQTYWDWNTTVKKWELKFEAKKMNPKKEKALKDIQRLNEIKKKQKQAEREKWGDFSSSDEDIPHGYQRDHSYKPPPQHPLQPHPGGTYGGLSEKGRPKGKGKG